MADIVFDENFVAPGKKDFKNFRNGCLDDEGWSEAYKGDKLKVFTKNVSHFILVHGLFTDPCFF